MGGPAGLGAAAISLTLTAKDGSLFVFFLVASLLIARATGRRPDVAAMAAADASPIKVKVASMSPTLAVMMSSPTPIAVNM